MLTQYQLFVTKEAAMLLIDLLHNDMTKLKLLLTVLALFDMLMLYWSFYLDRRIRGLNGTCRRTDDNLIDI